MNAVQYSDYWWERPSFPEMRDAIVDGLIHTFTKTPDGRYRCLSNPERYYTADELEIQEIHCTGVILYRIAAKDNSYSGTYYKYTTAY